MPDFINSVVISTAAKIGVVILCLIPLLAWLLYRKRASRQALTRTEQSIFATYAGKGDRQMVAVYRLPDRFVVSSMSESVLGGAWLVNDFAVAVPFAEASTLGQVVLKGLDRSASNVPWPTSWKGLHNHVHKAAGVRSTAAFERNSSLVDVLRSGDEFTITPYTRSGVKSGAVPVLERKLTLLQPSDTVLGNEVLNLLPKTSEKAVSAGR